MATPTQSTERIGPPPPQRRAPRIGPSGWLAMVAALAAILAVGVAVGGQHAQNTVDAASAGQAHAEAKATTAQVQATSAQVQANQGKVLADQVAAACATSGPARDALVAKGACQQAATVKQIPGPQGERGEPGRGVVGTYIAAGHLFVVYTDASTTDTGQVVGAKGDVGPSGVSVTGTRIDPVSGDLLITRTDGTTTDAGHVVGATGPQGPIGPTGPMGPSGLPGKNGTNGTNGTNGSPAQTEVYYYPNGTSTTCTRSGGPDTAPQYNCGPPTPTSSAPPTS